MTHNKHSFVKENSRLYNMIVYLPTVILATMSGKVYCLTVIVLRKWGTRPRFILLPWRRKPETGKRVVDTVYKLTVWSELLMSDFHEYCLHKKQCGNLFVLNTHRTDVIPDLLFIINELISTFQVNVKNLFCIIKKSAY